MATKDKSSVLNSRDSFSGRFGIIAAAAGSAIGLGNIWRFPYLCSENGGGAFLLVYLLCIVLIGLPIMLAEFSIGRSAQSNAYRAFKVLSPQKPWYLIGVIGILASFTIMAFYSAVGGWTIEYVVRATTNTLSGNHDEMFDTFIAGSYRPIAYQFVFLAISVGVVVIGVRKGIESSTKVLMPALFLLLIILCVRSLTLPGAREGLIFVLKPEFSKLTGNSILAAMGQAFFSLSIGMGCMITYGSYIKRTEDLNYTANVIVIAGTFVAILASIVIFPAAAALNIEVESGGPGLVFKTLPGMFEQMKGGVFFASLFFILLCIAALTSAISLLEVVVTFCVEELKIHRGWATALVATSMFLLGILCSLSLGIMPHLSLFGVNFFNLMDFISADIFLPLGGFFIAVYMGWALKKRITVKELTSGGTVAFSPLRIFYFLIKYIVPVAILIVFISGFWK